MADRTNQLSDRTLKPEIVEAFGTLKAFSKAAGFPYDTVNRVVNNKACSDDELFGVLKQWEILNPEIVDQHFNTIAIALNVKDITVEELWAKHQELYNVTLDLYTALKKTQEDLFPEASTTP